MGSFLLDSKVNERERHLADNKTDVAIMQSFFTKVGLSRERSIKCARKTVIRDILTPRRLFYHVHSVPEFSLLSLGYQILSVMKNNSIGTIFSLISIIAQLVIEL